MKRHIGLGIILLIGIVFSFQAIKPYLPSQKDEKGSSSVVLSQQSPSVPTLENSQVASPVRLVIPKIHVDADIEYVGLDAQGNMDIPEEDMNVAWYEPGYKLGEKGNTVLAGHFDKRSGAPAVFWDLATLETGDTIQVKGNNNKDYIYRVTSVEKYPYNAFPLAEVFGSSEVNRLNLITCEGTYNVSSQNYSHRVVVFSELIQ